MIKSASFGSVSTATLLTSELLDTFHDELEWQLNRQERTADNRDDIDRLHDVHGRIADECWNDNGDMIDDDDTLESALEELFDALDEFSPEYGYFGSHVGDGADFGYWPSWDSINESVCDGSILKVDDTGDVPGDYSGEVLHVNDHGNATLYVSENGELSEVWGIV